MKWHHRFMDKARMVSSWSKDTTKVGAVIADGRSVSVSEGFNGPPRGVQDDPTIDRETKLRRTLHAELNAVLFARRDLTGMTLYCTHHPCGPCAAVIAQVGITRVVIPDDQPQFSKRWDADIQEAKWTFKQAGVELMLLTD